MNDEEYQQLIEWQQRANEERSQRVNADMHNASSVFQSAQETNLIEWQLELDNILERVDHLLRGHILSFDKEGNLTWKEPEDTTHRVFNEYGVQEVLRILSMYLNRNTILSNYDETTINWKIEDFGMELTDLIFMKYEEMGLDNKEKIKLYSILVRELVDTVHSAYLRALNGGERESLRTARTVTQTEPIGQSNQVQNIMQPKRRSMLNPASWFGG